MRSYNLEPVVFCSYSYLWGLRKFDSSYSHTATVDTANVQWVKHRVPVVALVNSAEAGIHRTVSCDSGIKLDKQTFSLFTEKLKVNGWLFFVQPLPTIGGDGMCKISGFYIHLIHFYIDGFAR